MKAVKDRGWSEYHYEMDKAHLHKQKMSNVG